MTKMFFKILMLLSAALLLFATNAAAEDYHLDGGGMTTLPAKGVVRVLVGNSSVIKVEAAENDTLLIVRAVGNGLSELKLTYKDGHEITHTFRVTNTFAKPDKGRGVTNAADVAALLQGIKGIEIRQIGPRVVIDGHIMNEEDSERIKQVAEKVFPNGVVILAGDENQIMKEEENILVEFQLVEVNKTKGGQYGLKWNQLLSAARLEMGAAGRSGQRPSSFITIETGVDGFLQAMFTDGFGKIHDSHRIITVNRKEGQYFAGGEVGFRTVSRESSNVIYKEYGTKISVTPEVDKAGNIRLNLKVDISTLSGVSTDGVPNLSKKNVNNMVRLREGESIALSGMVSRVGSEDVERLPGLGHIPALGTLFSSTDFQKGDSEAVIFITARRMDAEDQENIDMIKKTQFRFQEIDENWWERK